MKIVTGTVGTQIIELNNPKLETISYISFDNDEKNNISEIKIRAESKITLNNFFYNLEYFCSICNKQEEVEKYYKKFQFRSSNKITINFKLNKNDWEIYSNDRGFIYIKKEIPLFYSNIIENSINLNDTYGNTFLVWENNNEIFNFFKEIKKELYK